MAGTGTAKTVRTDPEKTFRVKTGSGQDELVHAAKMEVASDGLTFKDSKGNVVGVFRGYGLSAVADENATAVQRDPCETVKASDFF
jgi:hypothetical protein